MFRYLFISAMLSVGALVMTESTVDAQKGGGAGATIRVLVPDGKARVWFDGTLTRQTGTDRLYSTPELTPGESYTYRIRAAWTQDGEEMIQEQAARVTAGKTTVVDFTRPVSDP